MILNVGGACFQTYAATLGNVSSFFSEFCGCSESSVIFIDRDPTHFRHILNFLRGSFTHPPTRLEISELMCEAAFYSLDGLHEKLAHLLRKCDSDLSFHLEKVAVKLS